MNFYNLLFFIFLTTSLPIIKITAAISKAEGIIGGDEAREGWFRYQVSVQANYSHRCGAGVIDLRFVLTAAQCFIDDRTGDFIHMHFTILVSFNIFYPNENSQRIDILRVYIPKSYLINNPDTSTIFSTPADIAIVELRRAFSMELNVRVQVLQIPMNFTHSRKTFIITGHGFHKFLTEENETSAENGPFLITDGNLRFAKAHIVTTRICEKYYNQSIHISKFCAAVVQPRGAQPRGVCGGDSGSPLVYNNEILYGILVGGASICDESQLPAIYTRISYYRRFLYDVLGGNVDLAIMRIATLAQDLITSEYFFEESS